MEPIGLITLARFPKIRAGIPARPALRRIVRGPMARKALQHFVPSFAALDIRRSDVDHDAVLDQRLFHGSEICRHGLGIQRGQRKMALLAVFLKVVAHRVELELRILEPG